MRVVHFLSAWLVTKILAASTNRTIDDTNGDSMTGAIPVYQPNESGVWAGPSCVGCAIVPDTSLAHDGTWSAATYNAGLGIMNISMDFTGTAVYVFFILANFQDEGITTTTKASFSVDGVQRGTFDHVPSDSFELQYDQLVFAETGLANTPHRLVVWTVADTDIYVNFDYALYTFEDVEQNPPTTTTAQLPPTHPIASTPSTSMPMASSTKSHFSSASVLLPSPFSASTTPASTSILSSSPSSSPSTSMSPHLTPRPHPHPAISIIVGSIIGLVVLLVTACGLWFLWRRKRSVRSQSTLKL